jgi:hypothetical protein
MNKSTSAILSIFVAFVLVFGIFSVKENIYGQTTTSTTNNAAIPPSTTATNNSMAPRTSSTAAAAPEEQQTVTTVTRDSTTLLLEGKTLPKGDFIELYDSTPFKIVDGHFVAKVPCNANGQSQVDFLIGQAPNLKSSGAEFVSQLSAPGKLCLYHVDLVSGSNNTITDVAIKNNSTNDIVFPPTSSVGIGVNAISPLPHEHE